MLEHLKRTRLTPARDGQRKRRFRSVIPAQVFIGVEPQRFCSTATRQHINLCQANARLPHGLTPAGATSLSSVIFYRRTFVLLLAWSWSRVADHADASRAGSAVHTSGVDRIRHLPPKIRPTVPNEFGCVYAAARTLTDHKVTDHSQNQKHSSGGYYSRFRHAFPVL